MLFGLVDLLLLVTFLFLFPCLPLLFPLLCILVVNLINSCTLRASWLTTLLLVFLWILLFGASFSGFYHFDFLLDSVQIIYLGLQIELQVVVNFVNKLGLLVTILYLAVEFPVALNLGSKFLVVSFAKVRPSHFLPNLLEFLSQIEAVQLLFLLLLFLFFQLLLPFKFVLLRSLVISISLKQLVELRAY